MNYFNPNPHVHLYHGSFHKVCSSWETPKVIISDGAHGIGGFEGDLLDIKDLRSWYLPHIVEWSKRSDSQTTLWFWCSEIGWATVHPLLEQYGWNYVSSIVWNRKVVSSNSKGYFPSTTEICVQYERDSALNFQKWMIKEWKRSGVPLKRANDACGVSNAATRKYLTKGNDWYMPSEDMFLKMSAYLNDHGKPSGKPYLDYTKLPWYEGSWESLNEPYKESREITNVWNDSIPKGFDLFEYNGLSHPKQKPEAIMERLIEVSSKEGDVVWDPFMGSSTSGVVSILRNRKYYGAEQDNTYFRLSKERISRLLHLKTEEKILPIGLLAEFMVE